MLADPRSVVGDGKCVQVDASQQHANKPAADFGGLGARGSGLGARAREKTAAITRAPWQPYAISRERHGRLGAASHRALAPK